MRRIHQIPSSVCRQLPKGRPRRELFVIVLERPQVTRSIFLGDQKVDQASGRRAISSFRVILYLLSMDYTHLRICPCCLGGAHLGGQSASWAMSASNRFASCIRSRSWSTKAAGTRALRLRPAPKTWYLKYGATRTVPEPSRAACFPELFGQSAAGHCRKESKLDQDGFADGVRIGWSRTCRVC